MKKIKQKDILQVNKDYEIRLINETGERIINMADFIAAGLKQLQSNAKGMYYIKKINCRTVKKESEVKMTNYFTNCRTEEDLKATYKQLVKQYHPDIYGEKGNEILKEIHNQLEKAVKNINVNYRAYTNYIDVDVKETPETMALKKELLKEAMNYTFVEGALFALYWENNLKVNNHRNPLTNHNFSGWNVWTLEIAYIKNNFKSCYWSTFAQYKTAKNSVKKGEKGTYITLAIYSKKKQEEDDEQEETRAQVYYKGYTVFNSEQTHETDETGAPEISEHKLIEMKKPVKSFEQKTLNLWQEKYTVIA